MAAPLFARPPRDAEEEHKIRKLAGARAISRSPGAHPGSVRPTAAT